MNLRGLFIHLKLNFRIEIMRVVHQMVAIILASGCTYQFEAGAQLTRVVDGNHANKLATTSGEGSLGVHVAFTKLPIVSLGLLAEPGGNSSWPVRLWYPGDKYWPFVSASQYRSGYPMYQRPENPEIKSYTANEISIGIATRNLVQPQNATPCNAFGGWSVEVIAGRFETSPHSWNFPNLAKESPHYLAVRGTMLVGLTNFIFVPINYSPAILYCYGT
jgi:hypothetical protein